MYESKFGPWIYLTQRCGITKIKLYELYKKFGSAQKIISAQKDELISQCKLNQEQADKITSYDEEKIADIINEINLEDINLICPECDIYPECFFEIKNPPMLLYVRGKLLNLNSYMCLASIGTRNPSEYGRHHTYRIVQEAASEGALIVSGLAQGIDAISHKAALDIGAPTVAIVGTGVDVVYPVTNLGIYKEIAKNGMIISEYPPKTGARNYNFPERNRLVASVCKGLFISEAELKSGSAITCRLAYQMGKDIFALPGNIDSARSDLPKDYLKKRAYAVSSGSEIIAYYKELYSENLALGKLLFEKETEMPKIKEDGPKNIAFDNFEKKGEYITDNISDNMKPEDKVLTCLKREALSIDSISALCRIPVSELNVVLLMLELDGKIKNDNGKYFIGGNV